MLYIRVDMNRIIATGHIMRCLAIANAAKRLGEDVTFILADGQAVELLEQHGHRTIIMNTQWNDMESELPVLNRLIEKHKIERILIDSYQITEKYLKILSAMVQTYYIDDLNAFLYPVNNIICYANYWEKFKYAERYQKTGLLLGTKYVPLRQEFCECGKKDISIRVKNLLLLSGGTDKYGIFHQILNRLNLDEYSQINVICGRFDMQYEKLKELESFYGNVKIYRSVVDIEKFMKEADIVISAGGITLYELCAVGTPSISYSIADNQLDNVKKFQDDGIIDYAGDVRKDDVAGNIERYLQLYNSNQKLRQERSKEMQKLVDGKGALRIAKVLISNKGRMV